MRIGVDIGGTKIEAIALAPDGGVLFRERLPTPRSYQGTLDAVAALIGQLERETGLRGPVGVGIPGTISPATGLVKNANSVWLNGRPFDRDLSDRLARPLRMTNDANCFALSEAVDGAGAGASSVFGVILGTGRGWRHRAGGSRARRRQRHRGRMGTQSAPLAKRRRAPGAQVFLRARRLCGDILLGSGHGARPQ
jgi:fructokinase